MSKLNSTTLNALRTLFGARAASRLFKQSRGRASHILEEARASYGAGWDARPSISVLMVVGRADLPHLAAAGSLRLHLQGRCPRRPHAPAGAQAQMV